MLCEWIKAAQAGDKESINKLIEKFQPLLRKYAYKLSYEDAYEDLLLYFIELILSLKSSILSNTNDARLVSYISKGVQNQYCHFIKKYIDSKNELQFSQLSEEQLHCIQQNLSTEDKETTLPFEILNTILTPKETTTILAIYYYGYTSAELAKRYHLTRQAVNQLKQRALKKLKAYFSSNL